MFFSVCVFDSMHLRAVRIEKEEMFLAFLCVYNNNIDERFGNWIQCTFRWKSIDLIALSRNSVQRVLDSPHFILIWCVFTGIFQNVQPWPFTIKRLLNKPYKNAVTLTGQNLPLKCYKPLETLTHFIKDLHLSMILATKNRICTVKLQLKLTLYSLNGGFSL